MQFTLREAAGVLDPPLSEWQLRQIVWALGWKPAGARKTGRPGHPVKTYDYEQIARLHKALLPFMELAVNRV